MNIHYSSNSIPVGLLRRCAAILYDGLLLLAVLFFASLIIMLPLKITYEHPYYFLFIIYIYSIPFIFLGWFWTRSGQTLGMKTWHIFVQQQNGELINWKQAFLRYISALSFWLPAALYPLIFPNYSQGFLLLAFFPVFFDYLWCLIDPGKKALHDIISQTRLTMRSTPKTTRE
jgi:uncharacterized RDD family membrane protein YckC